MRCFPWRCRRGVDGEWGLRTRRSALAGGWESGGLIRGKLLVGRVEVAVWVCEGLEILRLATADGSDGFVYGLAVRLIAFFENRMWQIGGILARGG